MTLTEFIEARLAEDEENASELHPYECASRNPISYPCDCPYPARALRDVEAKRRILAEVVPEIIGMDEQIISEWGTSQDVANAHLPLLNIMAAVYSDHPDYEPEWGVA